MRFLLVSPICGCWLLIRSEGQHLLIIHNNLILSSSWVLILSDAMSFWFSYNTHSVCKKSDVNLCYHFSCV